jgi:hypothetical protein
MHRDDRESQRRFEGGPDGSLTRWYAGRNPDTDDGLWRINGRRQTLYVKIDLKPEERLKAAKDHVLQQTKTAGNS